MSQSRKHFLRFCSPLRCALQTAECTQSFLGSAVLSLLLCLLYLALERFLVIARNMTTHTRTHTHTYHASPWNSQGSENIGIKVCSSRLSLTSDGPRIQGLLDRAAPAARHRASAEKSRPSTRTLYRISPRFSTCSGEARADQADRYPLSGKAAPQTQ